MLVLTWHQIHQCNIDFQLSIQYVSIDFLTRFSQTFASWWNRFVFVRFQFLQQRRCFRFIANSQRLQICSKRFHNTIFRTSSSSRCCEWVNEKNQIKSANQTKKPAGGTVRKSWIDLCSSFATFTTFCACRSVTQSKQRHETPWWSITNVFVPYRSWPFWFD